MWELDHKESWALKTWWFWTVVLEKTVESLLDCKEIQPVHKRNQSWIFIGRTDARKDWRWEKGKTEDEIAGWHHRLNGHEFEQALGVGDRKGSLACHNPWGHKESDMTERLNWTELNWTLAHQALLSMGFPSKITEASCHFFLQGIFPTQGSNLHLASPALIGSFFTTLPP